MTVSIAVLGALLLASSAFADDNSIHIKLLGKWQQSDGDAKSAWELKGAGDSMHVTNSSGAQTVADFDCNTVGKECAIEDGGRHSRVTMWFNGSKLVEMETRGSQVVKRRFSISSDTDSMELETIPIVPPGKSETAHFKRVSAATAKP